MLKQYQSDEESGQTPTIIRTYAPRLHKVTPSRAVQQTADRRATHRLPLRDRRAGARNAVLTDGRNRQDSRHQRTPRSHRPNALGADDEQHSLPCHRNRNALTDTRVSPSKAVHPLLIQLVLILLLILRRIDV